MSRGSLCIQNITKQNKTNKRRRSTKICFDEQRYAGNEKRTIPFLKLGARGAVAGMGNINALPQQLFETGDVRKMQSIQGVWTVSLL